MIQPFHFRLLTVFDEIHALYLGAMYILYVWWTLSIPARNKALKGTATSRQVLNIHIIHDLASICFNATLLSFCLSTTLSLFGFLLAWTLLRPCFPLTPQHTFFSFTTLCSQIQAGSGNEPFPSRSTSDHGVTSASFRGLEILKGKLVKWVGHRHHTWRWLLMLRNVLVSWWSYYCCYGIILPAGKKQTALRAFNWFLRNCWGTNWIEDIDIPPKKYCIPTHPYPAQKILGKPRNPIFFGFFVPSFFGAWNFCLHLEFWHCHDLNVASHKLRFLSGLSQQGEVSSSSREVWREDLVQMLRDVYFLISYQTLLERR